MAETWKSCCACVLQVPGLRVRGSSGALPRCCTLHQGCLQRTVWKSRAQPGWQLQGTLPKSTSMLLLNQDY